MTRQVIERDKLGPLTKIGQGGQGVVYQAPNVKTKFAASMVYKEYKAQGLAEIDFTALAAMPALVEQSLSYAQGERLISIAAWPCAIVEAAGGPTGFVMPAIPDEFVIPLTTAKGTSPSTAEFQHLLNHPAVLRARGIDLDDTQRYTLLREVVSGLAFLHKHGVCVGDISPKNLLFALTPREAIYLIDCDAMRINGVSALPQVETPGWDVPRGQELATIYSDSYKLGLLALRLLTGDQDSKNPQHLPSTTPALLRQIINDTLNNQPEQRPLPEAWTYILGHAIEEAQHRKKLAAPDSGLVPAALTPPSVPIVRSRPPVGASASRANARTWVPVGPSAQPPNPPVSSTTKVWAGVALASVVIAALVAITVVLANRNNGASSTSSTAPATYPSPGSQIQTAPPAAPSAQITQPPVAAPDITAVQQAACARLGPPQNSEGDRCAILTMQVSTASPEWVFVHGLGYYTGTDQPPSMEELSGQGEQMILDVRMQLTIGPTDSGFCPPQTGEFPETGYSAVPAAVLADFGLSPCAP